MTIMDLLVRLSNGSMVNIEIQVNRTRGFRKRMYYYGTQLMRRQLKNGESYHKILPVIVISVLDYDEFFENPNRPHSSFRLREDHLGFEYDDTLTLHFVELLKYKKSKDPKLKSWMKVFLFHDLVKEEKTILKGDLLVQKVVNRMVTITEEERAGYLELIRERDEMYRKSLEMERYEEVLNKGREEGIEQGNIKIVKVLARKNKSAEEIASLLELDLKFVESILVGVDAKKLAD